MVQSSISVDSGDEDTTMAKVAEDSSARVAENNADKDDDDIDIKDEEALVKSNLCPICKVSY